MNEARSSIPTLAGALTILIGVGAISYAFVLPYFFRIIYPEYIASVPYSQIFILTLFASVGNLIASVLLAHRSVRRLYVLNIITPIMQVVLQVVGIIWAGLWGLILARVAASVLFSLITIPIVLIQSRTSDASMNTVI